MPPRWMSSSKQSGFAAAPHSRNSSADANTTVARPSASSRSFVALSMLRSSSTTATTLLAFRHQRPALRHRASEAVRTSKPVFVMPDASKGETSPLGEGEAEAEPVGAAECTDAVPKRAVQQRLMRHGNCRQRSFLRWADLSVLRPARCRQQSKAFGNHRKFGERLHLEFLRHVVTVHLDGAFRDTKCIGDLLVRPAANQHRKDVVFARRSSCAKSDRKTEMWPSSSRACS